MDTGIEIVGVYRLRVTDELVTAMCEFLGEDQRRDAIDHLESTVLIEVAVEVDGPLDVGGFVQTIPGQHRGLAQAAYDEVYLSADGAKRLNRCPEHGAYRGVGIP